LSNGAQFRGEAKRWGNPGTRIGLYGVSEGEKDHLPFQKNTNLQGWEKGQKSEGKELSRGILFGPNVEGGGTLRHSRDTFQLEVSLKRKRKGAFPRGGCLPKHNEEVTLGGY